MMTLPRLKICSAPAKWMRFLRYKSSFWCTLAIDLAVALVQIALLRLFFSSGVQRTHAQIRLMRAIGKIDFVGVYGLLNDLLW